MFLKEGRYKDAKSIIETFPVQKKSIVVGMDV